MDIIAFLRTFRIGPFAILDFSVTYLAVYFLAPYAKKVGIKLNRKQLLWFTLPFVIVVHLLFGQMTPLTKMFLNTSGDYWVKLVIIFMIYMGFRSRKVN